MVELVDLVLVLTTVPIGDLGDRIARALVEERLAACVNILPPMVSVYRWRGAVEREEERQLLVKTTESRVDAVRRRISELHPYEVPEFLVLRVADAAPDYLEWARAQTRVD